MDTAVSDGKNVVKKQIYFRSTAHVEYKEKRY